MRHAKYFILATVAITFGLVISATPMTSALSGSDFASGRIIDDFVFTNTSTMSVQDIQSFLNSEVPNCDNWGTQPYNGTTRAAYTEAQGYLLPMTCLNGYYENPNTLANNLTVTQGQTAPIPPGAESAAQIIYNAAQQYDINPQVLLVLLQKEQGLVTDNWPWPTEYQAATGYGCPDSLPTCESQFYGFYNQVNDAAWQFDQYDNNPTSYSYRNGITRNIAYSPTSSCGSSPVALSDQSTADLYNYTPYQPDAAALANLTGTGDSCSSYGNRNFWYYFNAWFGSTYADDTDTPHPNGTLVSDGQHVYLISNDQRDMITSATVFNSYDYPWSAVLPASTGDNDLPLGTPISNLTPGTLASDNDGNVYIISTSDGTAQKQWISYSTFESLGYNWSQVMHVTQSDLPSSTVAGLYASAQHPAGTLVNINGSVYLMEASAKQYVSPLAFATNYFQWGNVMPGTPADAALPNDVSLGIGVGAMLYNNGSIYVTSYDTSGVFKQPVGPWECYANRLHYTTSSWFPVQASSLPTRTGNVFTC
jgi:hypothetical protein